MIFEYHLLFSYFLSILNASLAFGWESVDTCQMLYFQFLEGSAWQLDLYPIDFSTDKSNIYDLLTAIDKGVGTDHPIAKLIGITHMTFDVPAENDETVQTGTVFGESITTSNFTMTAMTFFKAKTDGDYKFTLEATDSAFASILADMSPYCCGNINDANIGDYIEAGMKYIWSIPTDPTPRNNTVTIPMREGVIYYIQLLYMNLSGDAKLKFTVTTPDGETTSDFSNYAAVPINPDCENFHTATTEYSGWTFDSTSTYSSTVVTIDMTTTTTLETVYYVVTPTAASSSIFESSSSEIPLTPDISSEVPLTSVVSSEVPPTSDVSSEVPPTSDVSSEVPPTSDVSSEVPPTSDVSSEVTVTSDISSELPLTSEVSSEDSMTLDASSVTLSDTLLTSTVTSSYASVDTSSTSPPESSISSSLEEADSAATSSTGETVTAEPSTAISTPSTLTTWSSSFFASWSISNASFTSSNTATSSDTTVSMDLESSSTSKSIGQETNSVATSNTALGNSDKTTSATVLSTTTATVCDTCAGEGIEQTTDTEANIAATGAATSNAQTNSAPIAMSSNTLGQEAISATAAASNTHANEESSAPSLSLAQGSSYTSTNTLQSSTPIVFSPENNNGVDQTRTNILTCLIALVLLV